MRRETAAAFLAAALLVAACDDDKDCTPEGLDRMTTDLMVQAQAYGAANPAKMATIGPKVADLVALSQTAPDDLEPVCDAVRALMVEVGG